jgi:hypothetical protein
MKKVLSPSLCACVITLVIVSLVNLALYRVVPGNDRLSFLIIQGSDLGCALFLALLIGPGCADMQRIGSEAHPVRLHPEYGAEISPAVHPASHATVPGEEPRPFVSRWGASRNPSVNALLAVCEGICQACEAMETEDGGQEQAPQERDDETA